MTVEAGKCGQLDSLSYGAPKRKQTDEPLFITSIFNFYQLKLHATLLWFIFYKVNSAMICDTMVFSPSRRNTTSSTHQVPPSLWTSWWVDHFATTMATADMRSPLKLKGNCTIVTGNEVSSIFWFKFNF